MNYNIKNSIDNITIQNGAKERMYANILAKADEQKKMNFSSNILKMVSAAAALVILFCAAIVLSNLQKSNDISVGTEGIVTIQTDIDTTYDFTAATETETTPKVQIANPWANNYTIDDVRNAGLNVTLPNNAEYVSCLIFEQVQANVKFMYNEHEYSYSISTEDGDLSGIYNITKATEIISEEKGIVLEITEGDYYKAHWNGDKYNYYLSNSDGADKDELVNLINEMSEQAE